MDHGQKIAEDLAFRKCSIMDAMHRIGALIYREREACINIAIDHSCKNHMCNCQSEIREAIEQRTKRAE